MRVFFKENIQEKNNFFYLKNIERDENESIEIVMKIKADPSLPDSLKAALESGVFNGGRIVGNDLDQSKQEGNDNKQCRKTNRCNEE